MFNISQVVVGPIHVHHNGSQSTIDLVFASNHIKVNSCETLPPLCNSDHYGVLTQIELRSSINQPSCKGRLVWRYNYADWCLASNIIENTNWDLLFSEDNIELSWTSWKQRFMLIMKECIPNTTLRSRRNLPWLNKQLIQAMKRRNKLFKQAKISGDFSKYKVARNKTLQQLRSAKHAYLAQLNPRDPKSFWKTVKFLNKKQKSIPTLSQGEIVASTSIDKTKMLNKFFCSCFNTDFPPLTSKCIQHQSNPIQESLLCTEDEVHQLLLSLDVSKSNGPDGILPTMLKHTAGSITSSLTKVLNLSIRLGQLPSQWKQSLIVPIPKTSSADSPSCYRPISLLPVVSKILERHICDLLQDHLQSLNFISDKQWGFQEGRSTVTALIKCTDDWLKELEVGNDICAVFFYFRKAFDLVPHEPHFQKLSSLNLDDCILNWLHDYLCNRLQAVIVDGDESENSSVLSGVPQGSVLGPLLFLIYINDLTNVVVHRNSNVNMFADDVLLYHTISCPDDYLDAQHSISTIEHWSSDNHLQLNALKCKCMTISRKKEPITPLHDLVLNNGTLEKVQSYKYLGLLLTVDLSWSSHIASICLKARKILGLLYRRFYGNVNQDVLKQLYLSLVRPHLEYGCHVWKPHLENDKRELEKVQKFACRIATAHWDDSYDNLLHLLNLQPLQERRIHARLGMLYRIIYKLSYYPEDTFKLRASSLPT